MSMSADMFLDLSTMSALSGEERTPNASAQVERAGWCCRCPDSGTHTCWGRATVMVLVSSSSGPRVGGCPRAWRDFGPHTVCSLTSDQKSAPKYTTQSARVVCAVLLVAYLPYGGRPVGCKSMRCKESSIDRTGSATCRGLCPRLCEYGIINRTESSISPPVQSLSQYCESNTATESLESRNAVSLHLRRRPRCPL